MNAGITRAEEWVQESYAGGKDPAFAEMVGALGPLAPDELADIIDTDISLRLQSGRAVVLRRYLIGVPNLTDLPVAMDAAIEGCCRAEAERGEADPAAVLIRQHPDLESQIRRSEMIGRLFVQTAGKRAAPPSRALPCELGPSLADGRGRYELRELLGFGSQGGVYLAVDRQLSEPDHPAWVAVKVLRDRGGGPIDNQSWSSEATYLRRVAHPNVVRVLDRGCTAQREAFIVYDYVRGRNLRAIAEADSGRPGVRDAAAQVRDLARGVQAVHSAGLVHCDLKPDNVILDEEGVPRIADFGIAAPRQPWATTGAERFGSPAFMAPEQFRLEPGWLVPSSDIYALGAILYWLLCGELPNGGSLAEIERHMSPGGRDAAPSPRAANPGVPADLDAICRRAMAPDVSERYSSAEMLAADLDAFLGHRPLPWRRYSGVGLLVLMCRRQPLMVGMSVGIAALALAVAGGALWMHEDRLNRDLQLQSLAATQAEHKEAERQKMIGSAIRTLEVMSRNDLGSEWLPMLSALEILGGPVLMGNESEPGSQWARRIVIVKGLIRNARALGRDDDLETRVWESALCLWLIRAGQSEEALGILDGNRAAWARRLEPDDQWLVRLDLLSACARTDVALKTASSDRRSANLPEVAELARLVKGGNDHDPITRLGRALLAKAHYEAPPDASN